MPYDTGELAVWLMTASPVRSGDALLIPQLPDVNWRIVAAGDSNRVGRADLFCQHATTGEVAVWFMEGRDVPGGERWCPIACPNPASLC